MIYNPERDILSLSEVPGSIWNIRCLVLANIGHNIINVRRRYMLFCSAEALQMGFEADVVMLAVPNNDTG